MLVGLYEVPEKPANAIEYVKSVFAAELSGAVIAPHLFIASLFSHVLCPMFSLSLLSLSFLSFIKEYLGASVSADTEKLKSTIDSQAKLIEEKEKEIQQLKRQVRTARKRMDDEKSKIVSWHWSTLHSYSWFSSPSVPVSFSSWSRSTCPPRNQPKR